jgi:hypothetical protein
VRTRVASSVASGSGVLIVAQSVWTIRTERLA